MIQITDIIELANKGKEAFEVKLVEEGGVNEYTLFVDQEEWSTVDYNVYMSNTDANGNPDFQMCLIIDKVHTIVSYIFMACIFQFAFLILDNIFQPFSKKNIRRLRIIAILMMFLGVIPFAVTAIMKMVYFSSTNVDYTSINLFIMLTGILFGVLSEIFKYGYELQDEMDQIC